MAVSPYPHLPEPPRGPAGASPPPPPSASVRRTRDQRLRLDALDAALRAYEINRANDILGLAERFRRFLAGEG